MKTKNGKTSKKSALKSTRKAMKKQIETSVSGAFEDALRNLGHEAKEWMKEIKRLSKSIAVKIAGRYRGGSESEDIAAKRSQGVDKRVKKPIKAKSGKAAVIVAEAGSASDLAPATVMEAAADAVTGKAPAVSASKGRATKAIAKKQTPSPSADGSANKPAATRKSNSTRASAAKAKTVGNSRENGGGKDPAPQVPKVRPAGTGSRATRGAVKTGGAAARSSKTKE